MNDQLTPKKWEELKRLYGENAHLMVEYFHGETKEWASAMSRSGNIYISILIRKNNELREKQSAALPFDLAAARAGDIVEIYMDDFGFLQCKNVIIHDDEIKFYLDFDTNQVRYKLAIPEYQNHLRMKHPRRIGVDYDS